MRRKCFLIIATEIHYAHLRIPHEPQLRNPHCGGLLGSFRRTGRPSADRHKDAEFSSASAHPPRGLKSILITRKNRHAEARLMLGR